MQQPIDNVTPPLTYGESEADSLAFDEPPRYVNTQVYLPGLDPNTNTAWLEEYGQRFGPIKSTRIIEGAQGKPAAGLIRFETEDAAKLLIADANETLGLRAAFARVNVRKELVACSDPLSTNLYLSNLPLDWSEEDVIDHLFPSPDFDVKSCRILRQNDRSGIIVPMHLKGPSRGVGFARVANRAQAEEAIKRLAGTFLPGSQLALQVRFADNDQQRSLKAAATAQRSYSSGPKRIVPRPGVSMMPKPIYGPMPVPMPQGSWPAALYLQQLQQYASQPMAQASLSAMSSQQSYDPYAMAQQMSVMPALYSQGQMAGAGYELPSPPTSASHQPPSPVFHPGFVPAPLSVASLRRDQPQSPPSSMSSSRPASLSMLPPQRAPSADDFAGLEGQLGRLGLN